MSIVSDILPTLDAALSLLDDVGLCPFSVSVRITTWSGMGPGDGTASVAETAITVGGKRPLVRLITDKDVVADGTSNVARYSIENLTPLFTGGGNDPLILDPVATASPTEVFYVLKGPGMPPSGMLCKKISHRFDNVLSYSVVVESTGQAA